MRPDVWIEWGRHDLHAAQACMDKGEHHFACYLSAQGAEKSLKAVMEHVGEAMPSTQALVTLREQLATAGCRLDISGQVIRTLTRYATDALQPPGDSDCMPEELYGADDARDALAAARCVHDTCHSAIAATPGSDG